MNSPLADAGYADPTMQEQIVKGEIVVVAQIVEQTTEIAAGDDDGVGFVQAQEAPDTNNPEDERGHHAPRQ